MIAMIRGRVFRKTEESVVVDTGAVGYEVWVPSRLLSELREDEEILLHIHEQAREEGPVLYGFPETAALRLFRRLLSVSGVGPKLAMTMLSAKSPREIMLAIVQERPDVLGEVSGIGQKTARRMILELRDRMLEEPGLVPAPDGLPEWAQESPGLDTQGAEALEGLLALGYTRREVERVVQALLREQPEAPAADLITRALRQLGRQRSF